MPISARPSIARCIAAGSSLGAMQALAALHLLAGARQSAAAALMYSMPLDGAARNVTRISATPTRSISVCSTESTVVKNWRWPRRRAGTSASTPLLRRATRPTPGRAAARLLRTTLRASLLLAPRADASAPTAVGQLGPAVGERRGAAGQHARVAQRRHRPGGAVVAGRAGRDAATSAELADTAADDGERRGGARGAAERREERSAGGAVEIEAGAGAAC